MENSLAVPARREMFSFSETAKSELLRAPTIPKKFLLVLFMMFPFLQPLLASLSSTAMRIHWVALALCGSDFAMECVRRWSSGTLSSAAKVPRSTREKLEFLWRYTVDAVRWLVVCGLLISLGFSLFAGLLGLYALFLILWGRSLSHVGIIVRWVAEHLFPGLVPRHPDSKGTSSAGHQASGTRKERAQRSTSLKASSDSRCAVVDEGPHFRCDARGSLLGEF